MRNILIKIKYDGTGFCGWQRQPQARTVCGELEEVMSRVLGAPVKLDATSRTDAGVHALGQMATFQGDYGIPTERICTAVNDALARDRLERVGEIELVSAAEVPPDFHARFSAKGKRYIYKISNSPEADLFKRNYIYQVQKKLDVEKMRAAAEYIKGTHDFACFQSAGSTPKETTVRTVSQLDIVQNGMDIEIRIAGDGFLYNMVRIITGTLVETGLGKRAPEEMKAVIESKDRSKAGHTAPPQGLYLQEVFY